MAKKGTVTESKALAQSKKWRKRTLLAFRALPKAAQDMNRSCYRASCSESELGRRCARVGDPNGMRGAFGEGKLKFYTSCW